MNKELSTIQKEIEDAKKELNKVNKLHAEINAMALDLEKRNSLMDDNLKIKANKIVELSAEIKERQEMIEILIAKQKELAEKPKVKTVEVIKEIMIENPDLARKEEEINNREKSLDDREANIVQAEKETESKLKDVEIKHIELNNACSQLVKDIKELEEKKKNINLDPIVKEVIHEVPIDDKNVKNRENAVKEAEYELDKRETIIYQREQSLDKEEEDMKIRKKALDDYEAGVKAEMEIYLTKKAEYTGMIKKLQSEKRINANK